MKIYLAGPFFNEEELGNCEKVEQILEERGFHVFSPRKFYVEETMGTPLWSMRVFEEDRKHIEMSDAVVLLYYGNYSDSGTAWECGYAYGIRKPVIVIHFGEDSNLMMHEGCTSNITVDELADYDFVNLPTRKYSGKMF